MPRRVWILPLALFSLAAPARAAGPIEPAKLPADKVADYQADIAPLFAAKCAVCHAGKDPEGGYDMTTLAAVRKGGKRGAKVLVPGKPAESFLYTSSSHNAKPVMPPKTEDNDLTPDEVAVLKLWIEQGAKGPADAATLKPKAAAVIGFAPAAVTPVRAVAIRPDKSTVAVGRGNQLLLFDAAKGELRATLTDPALGDGPKAAHRSLVESLAYSPDGKTIATGSYQEVTLWDAETGEVKTRVPGFRERVVAIAFSPDGKLLATGGGVPAEDGELRLLDAATGKVLLDQVGTHSDTIFGLAFSPDGKQLATGGADKFVKLLEVPSGKVLKTFEGHTQHVMDVGFTPDGKRLVSAGADNLVKVWDVEKGEKLKDMGGHTKQVTRLAMLAKTPTFYTVSGDATARLWSAENFNAMRTFNEAKDFLYAVAVSPDGTLFATGGEDGSVRLYNAANGQLLKQLKPPAAGEAAKPAKGK